MTISGWIMITCSWTLILALVMFCYGRILRTRATLKAPLEIDTEQDIEQK